MAWRAISGSGLLLTAGRWLDGMWGGDCGGKCLWRKVGQPWRQGDTVEPLAGGGAIAVASPLSPVPAAAQ